MSEHYYLTVLGSCGTADSFRTAGWPSFVDAGVRVFDYIGRTGFTSLASAGLTDDELEPLEHGEFTTEWGRLMAAGELQKTQSARLLRGAKTNQVLLFDVVCDFIFQRHTTGDGRTFLSSWEVEQHYRVKPATTAEWLWERPYEPFRDDAVTFLRALREIRPDLRLAFHIAPICLNDGVRFKVDELNAQVDFYYAFCERLARDLEAALPGLVTLQADRAHWGADPDHPYRRYPFHYRLDYYLAFRRLVKRWLGLADVAEIDRDAAP